MHGSDFPRTRAARQQRLRSRTGMKRFFAVLLLMPSVAAAAANTAPTFDEKAAERFAKLALACVGKEYPNKISHVLNSDADVAPPRKLTPAFHGCYDWHSSVHGHWLLVRLLRTFPNASFCLAGARRAAQKSYDGKFETGSCVSSWRRADEF
jgi:hypothetical protein